MCLSVFCRISLFRAFKITNSVLMQLSKLRECEATDAEKLFFSEKKFLNAILRIKINYMKKNYFQ